MTGGCRQALVAPEAAVASAEAGEAAAASTAAAFISTVFFGVLGVIYHTDGHNGSVLVI